MIHQKIIKNTRRCKKNRIKKEHKIAFAHTEKSCQIPTIIVIVPSLTRLYSADRTWIFFTKNFLKNSKIITSINSYVPTF